MSEKNRSEDNDIGYSQIAPVDKHACGNCKDKQACISYFAHENAMMHKDMDNERSHRTTLFVCIFALLFALTFVIAYTLRMNTFASLIKEMNAAIVELAGAKGLLSP